MTLSGPVGSEDERAALVAQVEAVEGVESVIDELEVETGDSSAGDGDGTDGGDAEDGVEDDGDGDVAGPDVDLQAAVDGVLPDGVTAVLDGGAVTLSGPVGSEDERAALVAQVEAVEGVESVIDELEVETGDSSAGDGDGTDGGDETNDDEANDGGTDDGGTPAGAEGDTINELLDLAPITFEYRSSVVAADGQAVLDEVVAYLEANPDVAIEIQGHTDTTGTDAENLALSTERAESVLDYLEGAGIAADRLTAVGLGESAPKVDELTAEDRETNRRIELVILG